MKQIKRTLLAAAASMSLAVGLMPAVAMAATVKVQSGDSLWTIARSHHTTVQALESSNPGVNASNLLIGTTLQLPQSQTQSSYSVKSGDSLFLVARKFGISLSALEAANPGVSASNLQIGTILNIPSGTSKSTASSKTSSASSADLYWMARIIYAEAGDQTLNAQIGVGDVVWHREMSTKYPNTVKGVVFQVSNGYYQFSPVSNGTIYNAPSAQSVQAAKDVLEKHMDVVPGAYVFYTPSKTPSTSWVRKQPYVNTYDNMVFSV